MQKIYIKNTLLSIAIGLTLSACGGSNSTQTNTTDAQQNQNRGSNIPSDPNKDPTVSTRKSPMYTQGSSVYSFGIVGSQLNNKFTHTLLNNTITETLTFNQPNRIQNTYSLQDTYILSQAGVYIQKNNSLDRKSALPTHYFISDDGEKLITSFYNSEGVTPTVREALSYKSYDVSGLKINQYIYKNLLTNTDNPTSAAALNASTAVFPQESMVFIPDVTTVLDEHYQILIDHSVSYSSFDAVPKITDYPLTRVFGGLTIRYANSSTINYVLYNGKVYQALYYRKDHQIIFNKDNNYFYNKVAADAVASELILSCGTQKYTDSRSGCM
ncbi:hypothetical protein [Acinetobacter colistiniresistens]|uniref:hypothetical protein n=1 Tax=Acinetobacter colistiniresistens TaxID=280145 RepID=UPI002FE12F67